MVIAASKLKPLLLLGVDGVLNPFPGTQEGYHEYDLFHGDDEPVRLSPRHGEWLRELTSAFEIAWASAWGETANKLICPIFGLPAFHSGPGRGMGRRRHHRRGAGVGGTT